MSAKVINDVFINQEYHQNGEMTLTLVFFSFGAPIALAKRSQKKNTTTPK